MNIALTTTAVVFLFACWHVPINHILILISLTTLMCISTILFVIGEEAPGPLLSVFDEAPLQHKMLNFGLFQAKSYANGL